MATTIDRRCLWMVEFTKKEVDFLKRCSHRHYDRACQDLSAPGGMLNNLVSGRIGEFQFRNVDLLCKVLEQAQHEDSPRARQYGMRLAAYLRALLEERNKLSAQDDAPTLLRGLEELVKLQAHYAKLLNMYDGGERVAFESAEQWLARLRELDQQHREGGAK